MLGIFPSYFPICMLLGYTYYEYILFLEFPVFPISEQIPNAWSVIAVAMLESHVSNGKGRSMDANHMDFQKGIFDKFLSEFSELMLKLM